MKPRRTSRGARVAAHVFSFAGAMIFLGGGVDALAQRYVSSEDRTRFREQPYQQTEPGMLPPSAYVALAEKAVLKRYPKVQLSMAYEDGVVTRRFYHNAPKEDQDIVCVQFVYRTPIGGGGSISQKGYIRENPTRPVPVIQALIRKDRSKIYVNVVRYRHA